MKIISMKKMIFYILLLFNLSGALWFPVLETSLQMQGSFFLRSIVISLELRTMKAVRGLPGLSFLFHLLFLVSFTLLNDRHFPLKVRASQSPRAFANHAAQLLL